MPQLQRISLGRSPKLGFALLTVLAAIIVMTTLSAATAFSLTRYATATHAVAARNDAQPAAETQVTTTVASLDPTALVTQPVGYTNTTTTSSPNVTTVTHITKTQLTTLWILSVTTTIAGNHSTQRTVALSAKLMADPSPAIIPLPSYAWLTL